MNKLLLFAILAIAQSAFASKARVAALQEANHLVDVQTVFTNPAHINALTPYITFEMGTPQGAPSSEGGFARKLDGGAMLGVYLGHDNSSPLRDGTTYLKQRNPIEITYGSGNMGFAGSLSTTDDKLSGKKETTLVGKFGMTADNMSYWANLGLIQTAEVKAPAQKISAPQLSIGADMTSGTDRFFGSLAYSPAKVEVAPAPSVDNKLTALELGWLSHSLKKAETDIYYGLKLTYAQQDVGGKKITSTRLPVFFGIEHPVTSWAVFRGSVKQNVILGSTKDETKTAPLDEAASAPADTTFAGGLGFKYNSLTLDGTLAAANSGGINGTAFLTQASVTYNF